MSTSLLYHGWGLRGYSHQGTRFEEGAVRFEMTPQRTRMCCAAGGSLQVSRAGQVPRSSRALPIGGRAGLELTCRCSVWPAAPAARRVRRAIPGRPTACLRLAVGYLLPAAAAAFS